MRGGISCESSGLSLDASINREASDDAIKQDFSDPICTHNIFKTNEDDERNPLLAMNTQSSDSQPASTVNNTDIEQEGEITEKSPCDAGTYPAAGFNWDEGITAAEAELDKLGMVRIPSSELGRILIDDQLISIFDTDAVRQAKTFVVYDGLDVLACFTDYKNENAI